MANNIGVTGITAPIDTLSDQDTFPITYANKIAGGYKTVATIAERDALYPERLTVNTLVGVEETNTIYRWNGSSFVTDVKNYIGLSNVDNTSDANKPISIATQAALDTKLNVSQGVTAATPLGLYNAATNTYTNIGGATGNLSATPAVGLTNGSYYTVVNPGNVPFAGLNFSSGITLNNGDILSVYGTQWGRTPFTIGDKTITPSKTTFLKTVIDNTKSIPSATVLKSGKVLLAPKADGTLVNPDVIAIKAQSSSTKTRVDVIEPQVTINTNAITSINSKLPNKKTVINNSRGIIVGQVLKSGKVMTGLTQSGDFVNNTTNTLRTDVDNLKPLITAPNQYGFSKIWAYENGKVAMALKYNGEVYFAVSPTSTGTSLAEVDSVMLMGDKLFVLEGRTLQLFCKSMLKTLNNNPSAYKFAFQSINSANYPYQDISSVSFHVPQSNLGTTASLILRNTDIPDAEFKKDITIETSPMSKTGNKNILYIGDSLGNWSIDALVNKFSSTNLNVTSIGKRKLSGINNYSEGRSGWQASDFTYINTRFNPLAVGSEGTYTDGDSRNPFIRLATGGDNSSNVKNGYIFDYGFYLSRFSLPTPNIVILNLYTNDYYQYGAAQAITNVIESYRIIIQSILATSPTTKIGIAFPMVGWELSDSLNRYSNGIAQLFLQLSAIYRGNANVDLISSHAYLSNEYIFPLNTDSTNSQNQQIKGSISDAVHYVYTEIGKQMYTEPIFQFIHAKS